MVNKSIGQISQLNALYGCAGSKKLECPFKCYFIFDKIFP